MIYERIAACCRDYKMVSVYRKLEDKSKHLTGFALQCNESELLVAHVTPMGLYDGFFLLKMDTVHRIDCDSDYERKMEFLYRHKNQQHPVIDGLSTSKNSIIYDLLEYAKRHHLIVALDLEDTAINGMVMSYDTDHVELQSITDFGKADGISIIKLDTIFSFNLDTTDEQDLKIIYEKGFDPQPSIQSEITEKDQ